jgi:aspartate carbamoyltransferase catalytic subunit
MQKAIVDKDVIMMLRIQKERGGVSYVPSIREYSTLYCLKEEHLSQASKDVIIMHPGPMNRGTEIRDAVADGPYSVILDQVENGVAVRMAILYLLLGGES